MTDEVFTCSAGKDCTAPHPSRGKWEGWKGTAAQFGFRKDSRRNTRCANCRAALAATGAHRHHAIRETREPARDTKALRVVERWCGMRHQATRGWTTKEAIDWQWKRGVMLQEVWTLRMMRLAARADRCSLARQRIAARRLLGVAA